MDPNWWSGEKLRWMKNFLKIIGSSSYGRLWDDNRIIEYVRQEIDNLILLTTGVSYHLVVDKINRLLNDETNKVSLQVAFIDERNIVHLRNRQTPYQDRNIYPSIIPVEVNGNYPQQYEVYRISILAGLSDVGLKNYKNISIIASRFLKATQKMNEYERNGYWLIFNQELAKKFVSINSELKVINPSFVGELRAPYFVMVGKDLKSIRNCSSFKYRYDWLNRINMTVMDDDNYIPTNESSLEELLMYGHIFAQSGYLTMSKQIYPTSQAWNVFKTVYLMFFETINSKEYNDASLEIINSVFTEKILNRFPLSIQTFNYYLDDLRQDPSKQLLRMDQRTRTLSFVKEEDFGPAILVKIKDRQDEYSGGKNNQSKIDQSNYLNFIDQLRTKITAGIDKEEHLMVLDFLLNMNIYAGSNYKIQKAKLNKSELLEVDELKETTNSLNYLGRVITYAVNVLDINVDDFNRLMTALYDGPENASKWFYAPRINPFNKEVILDRGKWNKKMSFSQIAEFDVRCSDIDVGTDYIVFFRAWKRWRADLESAKWNPSSFYELYFTCPIAMDIRTYNRLLMKVQSLSKIETQNSLMKVVLLDERTAMPYVIETKRTVDKMRITPLFSRLKVIRMRNDYIDDEPTLSNMGFINRFGFLKLPLMKERINDQTIDAYGLNTDIKEQKRFLEDVHLEITVMHALFLAYLKPYINILDFSDENKIAYADTVRYLKRNNRYDKDIIEGQNTEFGIIYERHVSLIYDAMELLNNLITKLNANVTKTYNRTDPLYQEVLADLENPKDLIVLENRVGWITDSLIEAIIKKEAINTKEGYNDYPTPELWTEKDIRMLLLTDAAQKPDHNGVVFKEWWGLNNDPIKQASYISDDFVMQIYMLASVFTSRGPGFMQMLKARAAPDQLEAVATYCKNNGKNINSIPKTLMTTVVEENALGQKVSHLTGMRDYIRVLIHDYMKGWANKTLDILIKELTTIELSAFAKFRGREIVRGNNMCLSSGKYCSNSLGSIMVDFYRFMTIYKPNRKWPDVNKIKLKLNDDDDDHNPDRMKQ